MGDWSLDPLQLLPIVMVGVAYGVRARTLERRGNPVPRWKIALFALGLLLLLVSVVSPIAQLGEERFSFHMVQHILLGDLAPLALLAGLNGPLLRPLLALPPMQALRVLVHPLVALRSGSRTSTSGISRSRTPRRSTTASFTRSSTSRSSRRA